MKLDFNKMHGLGNDFVVVDDRSFTFEFEPDAIAWLCDRHFGVGADGLILVRPADTEHADLRMRYFNADGSESDMCGNGIRVFSKFVLDRGLFDGPVLRVQTGAGVKHVEFERDEGGLVSQVTVDMGEPILEPALVPTTLPATRDGVALSVDIATSMGTFAVTCVSMGNPHAVIFVDDVDEAPVEEVGAIIETHPAFPRKTNVEFAEVIEGEDLIRLRVWERGVGETLACGSGACATLVAATLHGLVDRAAQIELPGGLLDIRWNEDGRITMTGSAENVFVGSIALGDE